MFNKNITDGQLAASTYYIPLAPLLLRSIKIIILCLKIYFILYTHANILVFMIIVYLLLALKLVGHIKWFSYYYVTYTLWKYKRHISYFIQIVVQHIVSWYSQTAIWKKSHIFQDTQKTVRYIYMWKYKFEGDIIFVKHNWPFHECVWPQIWL